MKQIKLGKKWSPQKLSNFNREMRSFNVSPIQNRNTPNNSLIPFGGNFKA